MSAVPMPPKADSSFLVIRRDNIGDLVCTTPVFEALRMRFPQARIYALTNSYNLPVLKGNPFIDRAFAYTKAKHRPAGASVWRVYAEQLRVIGQLRRLRVDYAILGSCGYVPRALSLARLVRPCHVVGHVPQGMQVRGIDLSVAWQPSRPIHEVEDVFSVLAPLGIKGEPPPPRVVPDEAARAQAEATLERAGVRSPVGVHISARKPGNRWPTEKFIELMRRLHEDHAAAFMLFWSPGDEDNPHHPGDDRKAKAIQVALPGVPIVPYPTQQLEELIAGLSECERVICSDGGAMHIAAALGKPIVCFFGNSGPERWHPWKVPHVVLQPASCDAADISVEQALSAYRQLLGRGQ